MTKLEFLLNQKAYCEKWLAVDADKLPGTLTHSKLVDLQIETEVALVDHIVIRLGADGKYYSTYA